MEETREELFKKLGRYFISSDTDYHSSTQHLNRALKDIDQRLNDLEFYFSNNGKKPNVSRAEKMLLLNELGVTQHLLKNFSAKKLSKILSLLLDADASNIESDLGECFNPNSYLKTKSNYKFLVRLFKELKLHKYEERFQNEVEKLED
jgi:hypothetical protein